MTKRVADADLPIHRVATTLSTVLIATHGLERAYQICTRVHEPGSGWLVTWGCYGSILEMVV